MQKLWDTLRRRNHHQNHSPSQLPQESIQEEQSQSKSETSVSHSPFHSRPLFPSPQTSTRSDQTSPPSPSFLVSLTKRFSGSFDRTSAGNALLSKNTIKSSSISGEKDGEGGCHKQSDQQEVGTKGGRPTGLSWKDNQRGNKRFFSRAETITGEGSACPSSSTSFPWERQHKEYHDDEHKTKKKYEQQEDNNKGQYKKDDKEAREETQQEKVAGGTLRKLFDHHRSRSHFQDKHDNRGSLKQRDTCSSSSPWTPKEGHVERYLTQESLLSCTANTVETTRAGRPLSSVLSAPASSSPKTRGDLVTCSPTSSSTTFSSVCFLTSPPLTASPIHLSALQSSSSKTTTSSSSSTDSVSLFAFCSPSTPNRTLPSHPFPESCLKAGFQQLVEDDSASENDDDDDEDADIFEESLNYHLMSYRKEKEEEERMSGSRDYSSAVTSSMQYPHSSSKASPCEAVSNKQVPKSPTKCLSSSHAITSSSSSSTSTAKRVLMKIRGVGSSVGDKSSKETGSGSTGSSNNPSPRTSSSSYDDQGAHILTVSAAGNVSLKSSSASSTTNSSASSGSGTTGGSTVVHATAITDNTAWRSSSSVSPGLTMNRVLSSSKIEDNSSSCSSFLSPSPSSSEILEGIAASGCKSSRSKSFDSATQQQQQNVQHHSMSGAASGGSVGEAGVTYSTTCLSPSAAGSHSRRNRASGGLLEIPKWKMFIRRSSAGQSTAASQQHQQSLQQQTSSSPSCSTTSLSDASFWKDCVHCLLLDEFNKNTNVNLTDDVVAASSSMSHGTWSSSPPLDQYRTSTMTRSDGSLSSEGSQDSDADISRSDASRKSASGESLDILDDEGGSGGSSVGSTGTAFKCHSPIPLLTLSIAEPEECCPVEEDLGNGVTVISLEVPVLPKSGRSASMDSSYLQVPRRHDVMDFEPPPGKSNRSRSVDIALPVGSDGPYIIVPSEKPIPATTQKAIQGEIKISTENGETRTLRCAPDWGETAINGDHLWVPTSTSGDLCYVGDAECSKQGPRLCCPVCKITAHTGCIGILIDKIKFHCRPTFKDVGVRQYREQTVIPHHWVHRRHQKGRCKQCGKSFQSKLSFGNKEIVALSCSWCKSTYHNKESCFTMDRLSEMCKMGPHGDLIIPPSWIVKLPRKGSFKSSIRRSPKVRRSSSKRRFKKEVSTGNLPPPIVSDATPVSSYPVPASSSLFPSSCLENQESNENNPEGLSMPQSGLSSQQQHHPNIPVASSHSGRDLMIADKKGRDFNEESGSQDDKPFLTVSNVSNINDICNYNNNTTNLSFISDNNNKTSNNHNNLASSTGIVSSSQAVQRHQQREEYSEDATSLPSKVMTTTGTTAGNVIITTSNVTSIRSLAPVAVGSSTGHHRSFAIKPIPSSTTKPLLVFINPKSGGNQGGKLIQKFQWLLNPRQVFDLTQGGPKIGLELYKKVQNLRILACGGDGTAGWIFSALDDLGIKPPVAVLPLGTGNDLARAFGWGGGYTDEPVSKILFNVKDGEIVQLDRWDVLVEKNTNAVNLSCLDSEPSTSSLVDDIPLSTGKPSSVSSEDIQGSDCLPTNVINNYFSIGVDAHIALEFHEAREAHPERFNSRLRNKMFYGQAGGKDLLQRKWKDLCNYITLECDGVDLTQRLKDLKVHSLLFLNIPSYGGGTRPWGGNSPVYESPRTDDRLIEVIGLTTYQLPLLQAGGHGSCIAQCRSANIITTRTVPMQVDGEPCRLLPSIIRIKFRNQANIIAKAKTHTQAIHTPVLEKVTLSVRKLNLVDYETYHYEKDRLKQVSIHLGDLTMKSNLELDRVRHRINNMFDSDSGVDFLKMSDKIRDQDSKNSSAYNAKSQVSFSSSASTESSEPESEFRRSSIWSRSDLGRLSSDWCFIDSCTAERFFRVDRAQEHLHYVVDVCNDDLYILDAEDQDLSSSFTDISDIGIRKGSWVGELPVRQVDSPVTASEGPSVSSPISLVGEAAAAGRELLLSQCVNINTPSDFARTVKQENSPSDTTPAT